MAYQLGNNNIVDALLYNANGLPQDVISAIEFETTEHRSLNTKDIIFPVPTPLPDKWINLLNKQFYYLDIISNNPNTVVTIFSVFRDITGHFVNGVQLPIQMNPIVMPDGFYHAACDVEQALGLKDLYVLVTDIIPIANIKIFYATI